MGEKRVTCRIYRGKGGQGGTKGTGTGKNETWKRTKKEGEKGAPSYGARRGEMSRRRMSCYVRETIRSVFKAHKSVKGFKCP